MRRTFLPVLVCALLTLVSVGCGYRPVARGATRAGVQSVRVDLLRNATLKPLIENILTDEVVRELARRGSMTVVASEEDALLSGKVSGYSLGAISYTAADTVARYRVTVSAEMQLDRRQDGVVLWKGTLSRHEDFTASPDASVEKDRETAAARLACQRLAEDLFLHLIEDF